MMESIRNHPICFAIAIGVGAISLSVSIACIVIFGARQGTQSVSTSYMMGNNSMVTTKLTTTTTTTTTPPESEQPSSNGGSKSNCAFNAHAFFLLNNFIKDLCI